MLRFLLNVDGLDDAGLHGPTAGFGSHYNRTAATLAALADLPPAPPLDFVRDVPRCQLWYSRSSREPGRHPGLSTGRAA